MFLAVSGSFEEPTAIGSGVSTKFRKRSLFSFRPAIVVPSPTTEVYHGAFIPSCLAELTLHLSSVRVSYVAYEAGRGARLLATRPVYEVNFATWPLPRLADHLRVQAAEMKLWETKRRKSGIKEMYHPAQVFSLSSLLHIRSLAEPEYR